MFVIRNLLLAVAAVLDMGLSLYMILVFIRALISWVSPDPYNPIVQFLNASTEPVLRPIRRRLPMTGIDISPIVVILLIVFLRQFLVASLREAARAFG